jgi:hypothetical protein
MVITEKIDGTNSCVVVDDDGNVTAQSRKRVIVPGDDNYGFAGWVQQYADQLKGLGPGYHFGEWFGVGIQRGYGLYERRFALFNVNRWRDERPDCCHVVPTLYEGPFSDAVILGVASDLQAQGSLINPNVPAEGVMVYVHPLGVYIKHPFDPNPKGGD